MTSYGARPPSGLDLIRTMSSDRVPSLFADAVRAFCSAARAPSHMIGVCSAAISQDQHRALRGNSQHVVTYFLRAEGSPSTDLSVLQRVAPDEILFAGIVSADEAQTAVELALGGIRVVAVADGPTYEMLLHHPGFHHVVSRIHFDGMSFDSPA